MQNKGGDALSKMHEDVEFNTMVHYPDWVLEEAHRDERLKEIIDALQQGRVIKNGVLVGDIYPIPLGFSVVARVSLFPLRRTLKFLQDYSVISVEDKYLAKSLGGLLQPLNIPEKVWEEISTEFFLGQRFHDHLEKQEVEIPEENRAP
ncbi:hypothetical protein CR513_14594, partial [Mucuna pruriens]